MRRPSFALLLVARHAAALSASWMPTLPVQPEAQPTRMPETEPEHIAAAAALRATLDGAPPPQHNASWWASTNGSEHAHDHLLPPLHHAHDHLLDASSDSPPPAAPLTASPGLIQHVEGPSTRGWCVSALIATCLAFLLFGTELASLDCSRAYKLYREQQTGPAGKESATATSAGTGEPMLSGSLPGGVPTAAPSVRWADQDPRAQPHKWLVFTIMLLVILGSDMYTTMMTPFFPGEAQRAGVGQTYVGFYLGACSVTAGVVSPFAGRLLALFGANSVQRVALAFLAVVSIPQGLANQLGADGVVSAGGFVGLTLPLRLLEGVVMGVSETAILASIFAIFPISMVAPLMGLMMASRGLVAASAPVVGAALYEHHGMAAPYLVIGGLNLVTVLLVRACMRPLPPQGRPSADVRELLGLWRLVAANATMLVLFMVTFGIGGIAQPWLGTEPYALTPLQISAALTAMTVAAMVSSIFIGSAVGHYLGPVAGMWIGHVPVILGLSLIGAPPLIFGGLPLGSVPWAYGALLLVGVGVGIVVPSSISVFVLCIVDEGLTKRGTSAPLGVITAVVPFAAQALGPILANAVCDGAGPAWSGLVYAVLVLASLLLSLCAHSRFLGDHVMEEAPPDAEDGDSPKTPPKQS